MKSANILISLPSVFTDVSYSYFILCRPPSNVADVNQYSVPLMLDTDSLNFIVNSTLSQYKGNWQFCLVIKDNLGDLVAVTDYFVGRVKSGIAEEDQLAEQIKDSNLKLLYAADLEAEALRVIAEDERKLNETGRVTSAATMEINETNRQDNEADRIAAAIARVEEFGLMTTAYETATQENTVVELTAARHDNINNKNHANIGARLDETAEQINDLENETTAQLAQKANEYEVVKKVMVNLMISMNIQEDLYKV